MNEINEKLKEFFANETNARLVNSIIAVIICFAIYKVILIVLKKIEKGYANSDKESKKGSTYFRLFKSTLRYVFFIGVVLLLLQVNGVDLTSLFAGLGIVSVIVGLALQDWLKDIIRGSSILSDGYFAVGDVVISFTATYLQLITLSFSLTASTIDLITSSASLTLTVYEIGTLI